MYDIRLVNFNKIMNRIPWNKRTYFVSKLKNLTLSETSAKESLSYRKEALTFDIYRVIRHTPLMEFSLTSMMNKQDIKDYNLSKQIISGLNGYIQAPIEKQEALQKNLLNPWMAKNILIRSCDFSKKHILSPTKSAILHLSKYLRMR